MNKKLLWAYFVVKKTLHHNLPYAILFLIYFKNTRPWIAASWCLEKGFWQF